jgi:hypothetical protein
MMTTLMLSENMALAARSRVERMTGIEPALSAWELACHARSDHEFAGHRQSGPCPLLTALHRQSPVDRARSGHDAGPATGSFEQPLTRSSHVLSELPLSW